MQFLSLVKQTIRDILLKINLKQRELVFTTTALM